MSDPIEAHIDIDHAQGVYIINQTLAVTFDDALDQIERMVIELVGRGVLDGGYLDNELTAVRASRGTLATYDTLINLREKLHTVCDEQGDTAMFNLSPQLTGLEGHWVFVTDEGERRKFVVGTSLGWAPTHLEKGLPSDPTGRPALREYDEVEDLGRPG